jgi:hypothetical protein
MTVKAGNYPVKINGSEYLKPITVEQAQVAELEVGNNEERHK